MFLTAPSRTLTVAAVLFTCAAAAAHAYEHVTLRTGFSYDCVRQQPVEQDRVRLFLDAAGNSIDIPSSEIATVETLPDPLPTPAAALAVAPATPPAEAPANAVPAPTDIPALLDRAGTEHDIDEALLASIIHAESDFNSRAVSRAGARGLMQLMPETAAELGVADAFRADQNIAGGAAYLDALLTRYKDNLELALAAYNAGPAAVDRYHGIPPFYETRAYVARVMREFKRRRAALDAAAKRSTTAEAKRSTTATASIGPIIR